MIDKATVERIMAAVNIVEVIGDFVQLRKKGVNYQACCPFHDEKTPSFVVSPSKGFFKCFGCGKGGNAVGFVMEHENMTYPEAMKYLGRKYGIEVHERELSPEETRRNDNRESMMVLSHYAADWFSDQMFKTDMGQSLALGYFRGRGFTDQTIKKFGLGYCPEGGDTFTQAALADGYKEEFLVGTGLSGKRDDGRLYDRFFGRVMFPIHSVSGRVTAFGGRTLRTDTKKTAKYLNSPESEIYHKSNILYGLFFAKRAITSQDVCILVEGYTDVISMHQSGVENVVASSGTSLTTEQIRLISRFTKNITVIYDGDAAGIKASMRGIDMILREGMNVRVVPMPDGEDPDSFARSHSGEETRGYIEAHEEDFITFKARMLLSDAGSDPLKRAALISDVVGSIAEIPDPIVRSVYIRDTARMLDTEVELVAQEVAKRRLSHGADTQTREFIRNQTREVAAQSAAEKPPKGPAGSSIEELEKELVKYLLKYGDRDFEYKEGKNLVSLNVAGLIINDLEANGLSMRDQRCKTLYESYSKAYNSEAEEPVDLAEFINHPDPEVANTAVDILTSDDNYVASKLWDRHDIVIESEDEKLAVTVPRLVILYKSKAIELIIETLKAQLADPELPDEQQSEIIRRLDALNKERMTIARKLSRLIL